MKKRRGIFFLMILGLVVSAEGATWKKEKSGTLAWLHAIQFVDASHGFAAGSNGTLLATSDGGTLWRKIPVGSNDTIRDIYFRDRSNGWLLCDRGRFQIGTAKNASYLLRTTDGGGSWTTLELRSSAERFSRLFFSEGGKGYFIGEGGIIAGLSDTDGSETRSSLPLRFLMVDGVALGNSRLLLTGGGGSIITSDDGGQNWQEAKFLGGRPEAKLNAVFFIDDKRGWAAGNGGTLLATDDGGRTWKSRAMETAVNIFDIEFFDRNKGFAVGDGGIILRTEDSGSTWAVENSGLKHRLERLAFAGNKIMAVGYGGTIVSTELR